MCRGTEGWTVSSSWAEGHREEKQRGGQKCRTDQEGSCWGGGAKKGHMLKILGNQRAGSLCLSEKGEGESRARMG